MEYERCPGCHGVGHGYNVQQCKKCGGFWCYKSGTFTSKGCGAAINFCPHCKVRLESGFFTSNFHTIGYIV